MIPRLLILSFVLFSFMAPANNSELIQWTSGRRLSWNDFKAVPPSNAGNAALTSSGIFFSFSTNGESFSYELGCNFDQNNSWGRVKNDHILSHEQGHFDIAEIYTRKLNKALKNYRYRPRSFNKDVNTLYQGIMNELQQTQDRYDGQTDHSRNKIQQKEWLQKIDLSLSELKAFSNYK